MEKETKRIVLPDGWEIDKVKGNEIILKESKKELPKTWEECIAKVENLEFINRIGDIEKAKFDLQVAFNHRNDIPKGLGKPMVALCQLLVCREVYRQGWKPDWRDGNEESKYVILYENSITGICVKTYYTSKHLLSFQSAEIRDKFLENFRDLIEEAKELI